MRLPICSSSVMLRRMSSIEPLISPRIQRKYAATFGN